MPTGRACTSGAVPRASTISNGAAGLLPLDAVGVDRVHQRDGREVRSDLAGQFQAVVEVAVDLDDLGAVHDSLRELAHRDLDLRDQHRTGDAVLSGIRPPPRLTCCPWTRTARPTRQRLGDRNGHAAVLERTGRVEPLDLEMHCVAGEFT